MIFFTLILAGIVFLYVLTGILIHLGLSKKFERSNLQPFVSVLVSARNEEMTLAACLDSLAMSDYPQNKFEVIIINDHSTDQTAKIARTYCEHLQHFRLFEVKNEFDGLRGKMNALAQAIEVAVGEFILITDADCRVEKTWLSALVSGFTAQSTMVGGLTLIKLSPNKNSTFKHLQALDLLFLQAIASGTAGIGLPVSILGNNFGFKKAVYEEIGGFRRIGFSLTEDLALMQQMISRTEYKLNYDLQQPAVIHTIPLENFANFFSQRIRWLQNGKKNSIWGYFLMGMSLITRLTLLSAILFSIRIPALLLLTVMISLVDYSLILRLAGRPGQNKMLIYLPLFELFFCAYSLLLAFCLLCPGTIEWKGRKYAGRGGK